MSDPLPEPRGSSSVIKCEKHGLHYDSSRMSGCVICRREAGGGSMAPPTAGMSAVAAGSADSGSLAQALAVTAVLLVLTTAALFFTHGFMAEALQSLNRPEARDLDRQMQEMGLPSDEQAGAAGPEDYGGEDGAEGD